MDKLTIDRIETLHPKLRADALCVYGKICDALKGRAMCRYAFTLRSIAEQNALYAQGRTKPGPIVTNARGGSSYHNYGLAIDIALIIDGKTASWDDKTDFDGDGVSDWMEIVKIFKANGWEWGGDWKSIKDRPHFQKTFGYSWQQLYKLYTAGKVDKNGYVLI